MIFKNIFGETVKNLKDFKLKIRTDLENQLEVQSNQKFTNDVEAYLVDNIKFKNNEINIELKKEIINIFVI